MVVLVIIVSSRASSPSRVCSMLSRAANRLLRTDRVQELYSVAKGRTQQEEQDEAGGRGDMARDLGMVVHRYCALT